MRRTVAFRQRWNVTFLCWLKRHCLPKASLEGTLTGLESKQPKIYFCQQKVCERSELIKERIKIIIKCLFEIMVH